MNGEFTHPSPPKPGMGSTVRRGKRLRLFSILFAVLLVGCSHDPNLRKQAYVASGNKYFDQGKYREAAIEYLNAVQIDNSYEDAHYRLAQCYLRQGIWRGAYQELTKSTELKPDDEKAQIGLGNLLLSSKQFKDAQAHAAGSPEARSAKCRRAHPDGQFGRGPRRRPAIVARDADRDPTRAR